MAVDPINALPERQHRHLLVAYNEFLRSDGVLQVWSRCPCGVEERRSFQVGEAGEPIRPTRLEYRLGGAWMTALDLIRRRDVPAAECPSCGGGGCDRCVGLGVVDERGGPIEPRRPEPPSAPAAAGWYDEAEDRIVLDEEAG